MRQSFRFVVSAYLDGKEVLTEEYSAPKNAPVTVDRVKGLAEGAAERVVRAFHQALDCAAPPVKEDQ